MLTVKVIMIIFVLLESERHHDSLDCMIHGQHTDKVLMKLKEVTSSANVSQHRVTERLCCYCKIRQTVSVTTNSIKLSQGPGEKHGLRNSLVKFTIYHFTRLARFPRHAINQKVQQLTIR